MLREKFAKLHSKYAFLCVLEASFSIMLFRDLLEERNWKMKMLQKHYGARWEFASKPSERPTQS